MDYKATEFFNNLNKAKPVIIKESKGNIEDKSLLGLFLKSNESNENPNSNKDIPNTNQININEEYSEKKIEIPNLNDLLNDFDEEEEENLTEKKEEEKLTEIKEEEKLTKIIEEEKLTEIKEEENLTEIKEEDNIISQCKEDITEIKEEEDMISNDKNNKNKEIFNSIEKSKSIDDIELIHKKIINTIFEKIDSKDILNNSMNYNEIKKNIDFENDESDDEGVNINNNLSDNDFDNEEEEEINKEINENKKEEKINKEEEKEKIFKNN